MAINKENIQLIIPMAGIGARFIQNGYKTPKPLLLVNNKPIIEHILNMFPGIDDVIFICNETHINNTEIKSVFSQLAPKAKIYTIKDHKKGPVYTISQIFDKIDNNKKTIVTYCDCFSYFDFNKFIKDSEESDGSLLCHIGFHPIMLGTDNYASCITKNKKLIKIREKEPVEDRFAEYMSAGTYYFKSGELLKKYFKELIDLNININNEYYVSLIYNLMVRDNLNVSVFEIENMINLGTPYDYEEFYGLANHFLKEKKEKTLNHNDDVTLIVPMAGAGSRFSKEGFEVPKPLIEINKNPMFVSAVHSVPKTKNKVFICLQEHVDNFKIDYQIHKYFDDSKIFILDRLTEGQATTCATVIPTLDLEKPIFISACDNGVDYNETEYFKLVEDNKNDVIVWAFSNNQASRVNPDAYSWLEVNENNFLVREHSKHCPFENTQNKYAIIGTMFFRKAKYFIESLKTNYKNDIRTNNEFYVDDLLNTLLLMGLNIKIFPVEQYLGWGTPNDYKTYLYWQEYFKKI